MLFFIMICDRLLIKKKKKKKNYDLWQADSIILLKLF